MKCMLIKTQKIESTMYRYYLTQTHSLHIPGKVVYGAGIQKSGENMIFVNDVDFQKERMIDFVKELAKGFSLPENLKEYCEDYVDMLDYRGMVK